MNDDARKPTPEAVAPERDGDRLPWTAPTVSRLGTGQTEFACFPGPDGGCTTGTTVS